MEEEVRKLKKALQDEKATVLLLRADIKKVWLFKIWLEFVVVNATLVIKYILVFARTLGENKLPKTKMEERVQIQGEHYRSSREVSQ